MSNTVSTFRSVLKGYQVTQEKVSPTRLISTMAIGFHYIYEYTITSEAITHRASIEEFRLPNFKRY